MNDDRVLGVRQLPDGEELVAHVESRAPLSVGGKLPLVASAERRHDAITERRQKPPFTWEVAEFVVLESSPHNSARRRMAWQTDSRPEP